MSSQSPTECTVSGALAFALRMSRAAGIAPLQFKRLRTGWRARVSLAANLYSEVLAVTLCILALSAFVKDLCIEPERSLKTGTRARRSLYFVDLAIMTLVVLTASFTGPMRMRNMMIYLNQIHKINFELSSYGRTPPNDKKLWLLLTLSIIGGTFTIATDFVVFMYNVITTHERVLISTMFVFYNFLYMTRLILLIQFALIAMTALSPLKRLNGCLKDLLQEINLQAYTNDVIISSQKKQKINNFIISHKYDYVNHVIDSMGAKDNNVAITRISTKGPRCVQEAVRHLAGLHGCVCEVVRQVDQSHGLILLMLLLSYLLHLVITLYCLISSFLIHTESFPYNPVIQCFWGTFHISSLIIAVEPCHRTQDEMEITREIVSQMTQKIISPNDRLSIELELFFRHLTLNRVTYSPLKMLTVNRELVIKMLSAITTYLVVVIQF